jgi:hypothetical protein
VLLENPDGSDGNWADFVVFVYGGLPQPVDGVLPSRGGGLIAVTDLPEDERLAYVTQKVAGWRKLWIGMFPQLCARGGLLRYLRGCMIRCWRFPVSYL